MDEFQLIRHYFASLTAGSEGVVLGIGDDAALLAVPTGQQLVVTTDTLVAGRHFPQATRPFDIGWKALAVNLSDLAAMGATPRWFTLALTLPAPDADWLSGFSEGLKALADLHGVALVGGDTTRGPLAISITAMGLVPAGKAMRRDGAVQGDLICVTGTLGDAALGLRLLAEEHADGEPPPPAPPRKGEGSNSSTASVECADQSPAPLWGGVRGGGVPQAQPFLIARLNRPRPRVEAGQILAKWGMAAIDLSDGLAGDLNHILIASQVGAELRADRLPRSATFASAAPADALALQLHGGDDYELCVCLRGEDYQAAQPALAALGVPLTRIGVITAEPGLRLREGAVVRPLEPRGYQHFHHEGPV